MRLRPPDFDLGHNVLEVDGEHDVLGDGSVGYLPAYLTLRGMSR